MERSRGGKRGGAGESMEERRKLTDEETVNLRCNHKIKINLFPISLVWFQCKKIAF